MRAPDGSELYRYSVDPAVEKAKRQAEWETEERNPRARHLGYSHDAGSFACAALAFKCRGEPLAWPPPPDPTPLEYSQRAREMQRAYGLPFVPQCTF
jgi:hypothetical protein